MVGDRKRRLRVGRPTRWRVEIGRIYKNIRVVKAIAG